MSIVLACTGRPQKQFAQLAALWPKLSQVYQSVILSVPPDTSADLVQQLEALGARVVVNADWPRGRHAAIQCALDSAATHIHYADLDRILQWVETDPDEWHEVVQRICTVDCLVIGRTDSAFQTHPQALQQTERLVNLVFSNRLGQTVDLGGGSRGFSRRAVELLVRTSRTRSAWSTDSEWVMLLHHAGYVIDYVAVDGLASPGYAADYDSGPNRWEFRLKVAYDIIEAGLACLETK